MSSIRHTPSFPASVTLAGFTGALVLWVTWFVTHLPWLGLTEPVSLPVVIAAWGMALAIAIGCISNRAARSLRIGAGAGLLGAMLGLLILGSKLTQHSAPDAAPTAVPNAALLALGFLVFGAVLGAAAGLAGTLICRPLLAPSPPAHAGATAHQSLLPRFAGLAAVSVAPLLFVGGLVTSTNSGMAVPDWPNTFGTNMFLYPLGPRVAPDVFFEHAHRLFGTFVGATVLALMIWTQRADDRRWVRRLAIFAFLLVCTQGILGGVRVQMGHADALKDAASGRYFAIGHGVLAQLTFACLVALAVVLSPLYKRARDLAAGDPPADAALARRVKLFASMLLHALILQLLLGAAYRHLRQDHALWGHIAFSLVVTIAAMSTGFIFTALTGKLGAALSRLGWSLVTVVLLQFTLGWLAFLFGTGGLRAETIAEAILRTAHQATGALLLAGATAAYVWAFRVRQTAANSPNRSALPTTSVAAAT